MIKYKTVVAGPERFGAWQTQDWCLNPWDAQFPRAAQIAVPRVSKSIRVCDLGCGPGLTTKQTVGLLGKSPIDVNITYVDIQQIAIDQARTIQLPSNCNPSYVVGDISRGLPYGGQNLLFVSEILHWIDPARLNQTLKEIASAASVGAIALFSVCSVFNRMGIGEGFEENLKRVLDASYEGETDKIFHGEADCYGYRPINLFTVNSLARLLLNHGLKPLHITPIQNDLFPNGHHNPQLPENFVAIAVKE